MIAFMESAAMGPDDPHPLLWISTSICLFMPEQAGLVTLSGLDDKRIPETLARVRAARVAGEAEAKAEAKRAETQPAPQPDPVLEKIKSKVPAN